MVVLAAGAIAGSRLVEAARAWREWHSWLGRDRPGAEAYRSFFFVNALVAILSLCLAALLWHLLRAKQDSGNRFPRR
jgi:hypothetical protein